jgi:hypothetical protein
MCGRRLGKTLRRHLRGLPTRPPSHPPVPPAGRKGEWTTRTSARTTPLPMTTCKSSTADLWRAARFSAGAGTIAPERQRRGKVDREGLAHRRWHPLPAGGREGAGGEGWEMLSIGGGQSGMLHALR